MANGKPHEAAHIVLHGLYATFPDRQAVPRGKAPYVPLESRQTALCALKLAGASQQLVELFQFMLCGFPAKKKDKPLNSRGTERRLSPRDRAIEYMAYNDGAVADALAKAVGIEWRTARAWLKDASFLADVETQRQILGSTPAARARRIADRAARRKTRAARQAALGEAIVQTIEAHERPNVG